MALVPHSSATETPFLHKAFTPSRFPTTLWAQTSSSSSSSSSSDQNRSKSARTPKPARFSQTVHSSKFKPLSSSSFSQRTTQNQQPGRTKSRTFDRGGKSIEELEETMVQRWNSEQQQQLQQKPASPRARIALENGRGDDLYENDDVDDVGSPMFRPRRVKDPWENDDAPMAPFQTTKKNSNVVANHGGASTTLTKNDNTDGASFQFMLQRVRRNQERLQQSQQQQKHPELDPRRKRSLQNSSTSPASKQQNTWKEETTSPASKQQNTWKEEKSNKRIYKMPKHAEETLVNDDDGVDDDDDDANEVPTNSFFFRPTTSSSSSRNDGESSTSTRLTDKMKGGTTPHQEEESEENQRRKRAAETIPSAPLVDERGNPLYLTLQQAESNFQKGLFAFDNNTNEQKSDDGEDYIYKLVLQEEDFSTNNLLTSRQTWQDLGITHPILLNNLQKMNCALPLAVQAKACPEIVLGDRDVVIGTYTGSGKTLAFLVPLVQRLFNNNMDKIKNTNHHHLKVLIVAPGRELASQIVSVARQVLEGTELTAMIAIGGTTFARNLEQLRKRKPDIIVGTPGRIAELVAGRPGSGGAANGNGRLKTSSLQALVLDEFDALLNYQPHSEPSLAILETLQQQRRRQQQQQQQEHNNNMSNKIDQNKLVSIFCSATATDVLDSPKVANFLHSGYALAMADDNDAFVTSSSSLSSPTVSAPPAPRVSKTVIHGVVHVPHRRFLLETLRRILHTEPYPQQILIFVQDARKVERIVERLGKMGILAAPLHGGNQSEKLDRAEVNKALREGEVGIVVATELAARGLDAPLLTHVINLDLPTDASHYAHRAGRCGRGGRPGVVLNLTVDPKERKVPQKLTRQLGVELYTVEVRNGKLNLVVDDIYDGSRSE
ncbi:hypothetical protein ACA910_007329 [Epithemia clementina (nom. ined.)]